MNLSWERTEARESEARRDQASASVLLEKAGGNSSEWVMTALYFHK
jgi:hypothetical protein